MNYFSSFFCFFLFCCQSSTVKQLPQFEHLIVSTDLCVTEALENDAIPSLSIAIYRDGQSYHNYYSSAGAPNQTEITNTSLFEIASLSKVFLGTLFAKAVLENKVSLEDDIRIYLEGDYSNLEFDGVPISLSNLLTHTLGFERPEGIKNLYKKMANGYYDNRHIDYDMFSLLEELQTVSLTHKPGTYYSYSNVGPELAAYILEKVYNIPYKEQLYSFLVSIGMNHTYLNDFEKHRNSLVLGYENKNTIASLDKNPLLGASGGMISTLPDLLQFMKFQLESANPIVKEATRILYEDDDDTVMGYLWENMGIGKEEGFYYWKTGDSNGIKSGMIVCPDSNYGAIILMNTQADEAIDSYWRLFDAIETDLIKYPKINLYRLTAPDFIKDKEMGLYKFNELKGDTSTYFNTNLNWTLNRIGYDLLLKNEVNKAIEMFQFAILHYPEDANLYDSLGEAYFIAKEYDKAFSNYTKSLALDPENQNAKDFLNRITMINSN